MKILGIETSCDETAISIIDIKGKAENLEIKILSELTHTQIKEHKKYGGVVPNIAKREHAKHLLPLLEQALKEAKLLQKDSILHKKVVEERVKKTLEREKNLSTKILNFTKKVELPGIDYIAVTNGPGLEPALWVGINFAKALSMIWNKPLIPVNHLEGHILSVLLNKEQKKITFPAVSLIISGGHTELIYIKKLLSYKLIGETRDDAVGEAFDKVARILGLPYPGGPEISKLAAKLAGPPKTEPLPRPMINSQDSDFSFSGLKTAVRYRVEKMGNLSDSMRKSIAKEFELAVTDILIKKTLWAVIKNKAKTIIIGGGVSANKRIRKEFLNKAEELKDLTLLIPDMKFTTDNATMIALSGYLTKHRAATPNRLGAIRAHGNLDLS